MKAPFPWYGGKLKVAHIVWAALGDVRHYIEPFFGSGAVFLNAPYPLRVSTLNEIDPMVVNFWRCVQAEPEALIRASMPVFESHLHAIHAFLVSRKDTLRERLEGDPDYTEPMLAAWWVWGVCCWIGGQWCGTKGPWKVNDARLVKDATLLGEGVSRRLPHLSKRGQGFLMSDDPMQWFRALSQRFEGARIACGDWERVCGPTTISSMNPTGIFFDPPYSLSMRAKYLYATEEDCTARVHAWCQQHGHDECLRIVLAGYEGEHNALEEAGWTVYAWKANGGYGNQTEQGQRNAGKERLWLSPHCDKQFLDRQGGLG